MILEKQNIPKVRITSDSDLNDLYSAETNRDLASTILDYHDGNDIQHIKVKMAERYASEITRTENSATGEPTYNSVKTKESQVAAIKNNLYEVVTKGMTRKIATNVARLFENSTFKYVTNGLPDPEFTAVMSEARKDGSFNLRASRMDEISVVTGSSAMLVQVLNNKLNYQPMAQDKIWIVFGNAIKTGARYSAVDILNIEDALTVIIQLDKDSYVAYFGRSDVYPNGRMVKYKASAWHKAPSLTPDAKDKEAQAIAASAEDYEIDGVIYNPLTYWQDKSEDYSSPEYPVITWQGSPAGVGNCILPTQTSLYESSKEIDLSASRTSMSANKAARGAWFFTSTDGATNEPTSFDEGVKTLEEGQSALVLSVPAGNIKTADTINNSNANYLSDQWGIPAYLLAVGENTTVPSAVALLELNRPAVMMQNKRAAINEESVDRLFDIEVALVSIETAKEVAADTEQIWEVSSLEVLQTKTELLNELKIEKDMGLIDNTGILLRLSNGLTTKEQAEEFLATIKPAPVSTVNRLGIV